MIHLLSSISISITDTFKVYQYRNVQCSVCSNSKISGSCELNETVLLFKCISCILSHVLCEQFGFPQYSVCSDLHFVFTRSE